jgi:hypothetical protein
MARKTLNRRELREESDAAAKVKAEGEEGASGAVAKKPAKAPPAKRKSRAKVAKEVRLKAFWGVFSQSLSQVATFEYDQRPQADTKAAELTESKKSPHFVQLVKKVIEE